MDNQVRYDYSDVPTVFRYSQDNTIIRSIIGPFGCLSGDTEFLSKQGWHRIDQYLGQEIAQFDAPSGKIEFFSPKEWIKLPCDFFYHLKSKYGIDQLLSGEHTVLFRTRFHPDKWQMISCLDLVEKHNRLRDGFSGRVPTVFLAPKTDGLDLDDDEIRLMVAISADGSFSKASPTNYCTFGLRKDRKKERLRRLLHSLELEWKEANYESRPTETVFSFYAPRRDKSLWSLFDSTSHQLSVIVDEAKYWDGHVDEYGGFIFTSIEKTNSDLIQYALATQGIRGTITPVDYENENWRTGWRVYGNTGATDLSLRQSPPIEKVLSEDGFKYCFKTQTGFFLARRNGRIFITGNSGKSSGAGVMEIVKRACAQAPSLKDGVRRSRAAVIRNTNRELLDTTMKTWDHWMSPFGYLEKTQKNFQLRLNAPDGSPVECEVMFRPLDMPDDVDNLLSLELTFAWFNEVREIAKLIFDTMLGRIGRYPAMDEGGASWYGMFGDTNPPDTDSWFYTLFEDERPLMCPVCQNPDGGMVLYTPREFEGRPVPPKCPKCGRGEEAGIPITAVYKQPSGRSLQAENLRNLPKGYYSNLMIGKDPGWITVYVDGKYGYVRDGKPVYPNWSDHFHLVPNEKVLKELEAHPSYPLICGWDCTGNHQAWTINQRLPNGKFCTYDEIFSESTDARTFLREIVKPFMWANYTGIPWGRIFVILDPAAKRSDSNPSNAKAEAKLLGIENVAKAFSNSWDARFGAVNRLLIGTPVEGTGRYQLNRRCKIAHKGFLGDYRMERKQVSGKEIFKDQPVKNKASDVHDSIQYAAMGPSREDEDSLYGHGHTARDHSSHISLGAHL